MNRMGVINMTELRTKLRNVSSKNQGLQDILRSCSEAKEILSVETHEGGVHNTKLTLLMKNGEERVHFYNRVELKNTIPEGFISSGDIDLDIEILNLAYGCDFTDDDVTMTCGNYAAKPASLGYFSKGTLQGSNLPANVVSFHLFTNIDTLEYNQFMAGVRVRTLQPNGEVIESIYRTPFLFRPDGIEDGANWLTHLNNELMPLFQNDVTEPITLSVKNILENINGTIHPNYIYTVVNDGELPIEIAVIMYCVVDRSISWANPMLPNTRLSATGGKLAYCPTSDFARFTPSDFVDFENGIWDGDDVYPLSVYVGELYSYNGAAKNSYFNDGFPEAFSSNNDAVPLNPYLEEMGGGLDNTLRCFIEANVYEYSYLMAEHSELDPAFNYPEKTVFLLKNTLSTPVMLEAASFSKPIILTGTKETTYPDQFMCHLGETFNMMKRPGAIIVDGNRFDFPPDSTWRHAINAFISTIPSIKSLLDISVMYENPARREFLYMRNLTNNPVTIQLLDADSVTMFNVTLAPKGTVGNKRTPTTPSWGEEALAPDFVYKFRGQELESKPYIPNWTSLSYSEGNTYLDRSLIPFYEEIEVTNIDGEVVFYALPEQITPATYHEPT